MRVGILTFHYVDNYDAVLQAYGLQQKVRDLGHDVHILHFRYQPPVKVTLTCSVEKPHLVAGERPIT